MKSLRNPVVSVLCLGLPMMVALLFVMRALLSKVEHVFNPPPFYGENLGAIAVLESERHWIDGTDGPRIHITGLVTNGSAIPWRDLEFECRFFDANDKLVDAANGRSSFTVLPGAVSAFRVSIQPLAASNEYQSFKISVSTARNGYSRF